MEKEINNIKVSKINTCLRYIPGQILTLEKSINKYNKNSNLGLFELFESLYFESVNISLNLYNSTIGEENRIIDLLLKNPNVISASYNFIGKIQSDSKNGVKTQSDPLWEVNNNKFNIYQEGRVNQPLIDNNSNIICIVDVSQSHLQKVKESIIAGYRLILNDNPNIISSYTQEDTGDFINLSSYLKLLMPLCEIKESIKFINLSVDWGVVCNEDKDNLLYPLSIQSFSIPIFDQVLNCIVESQRIRNFGDPIIFAAAGNLTNNTSSPKWRLAYPAIRPETVAVTFINKYQEGFTNNQDIPAIYKFKPCLALIYSDVIAKLSFTEPGTSYACAFACGYFSALFKRNNFTVNKYFTNYSKIFSYTTYISLENQIIKTWLKVGVNLIDINNNEENYKFNEGNIFRALIRILNRSFDNEFLISGSCALLSSYCSIHNNLDVTEIFEIAGDLDVLYTGSLNTQELVDVRYTINQWLKDNKYELINIDLKSIDKQISLIHLIQCVIPANSILISEFGIIDAWNGSEQILNKDFDIYLLDNENLWRLNPQYVCSSNGIGLGFLIYVNSMLMLQLLDNKSNIKWKNKIQQLSSYENDKILFGLNKEDDRYKRFSKRLKRAEELLGRLRKRNLNFQIIEDIKARYHRYSKE